MKKYRSAAVVLAVMMALSAAACANSKENTHKDDTPVAREETEKSEETTTAATEEIEADEASENSSGAEQDNELEAQDSSAQEDGYEEDDGSYSYEESYTKKFVDVIKSREFMAQTAEKNYTGEYGAPQMLYVNGNEIYNCIYYNNEETGEPVKAYELYVMADDTIEVYWLSHDHAEIPLEFSPYSDIAEDRIMRAVYLDSYEQFADMELSVTVDEEGRTVETFTNEDGIFHEYTFDPSTGYPVSVRGQYTEVLFEFFADSCDEIVFDGDLPEPLPQGDSPNIATGGFRFLP